MSQCGKCSCGGATNMAEYDGKFIGLFCSKCIVEVNRMCTVLYQNHNTAKILSYKALEAVYEGIVDEKISDAAYNTVNVLWETIAKELGATSGDVSPEMVVKIETVIMQAVKDYYEHNCK